MFITPAYAQAAANGAGQSSVLFSLLPFVLIFVVMYFLVMRPQQQRAKAHREMVKNVRRGDTVITSGGLIGRIAKVVDENEVQVEIADNVRVRIARAMITEVRTKGEPVKEVAESGQK